jgi:hypothetical protein
MTTYRQWANVMRLGYGPGEVDIESERPQLDLANSTDTRADFDAEVMLIELTGDEENLDVAMLLASGAITVYP